jgi:hypothetical protein
MRRLTALHSSLSRKETNMHVFLLILSIAGQPERLAAVCETYKQCSDQGAAASAVYQRQFNKLPSDFSYRVIPGLIVPERAT